MVLPTIVVSFLISGRIREPSPDPCLQTVQLRGGIEVIALARGRGVGRVSHGQF